MKGSKALTSFMDLAAVRLATARLAAVRLATARVATVGLAAACLAVMCVTLCGCSDDVVCPEFVPTSDPYVLARVTEVQDGRADATRVEIVCTADPLPGQLIAFVNGREIPTTGASPDLGLLATLEEDIVLWQPGVTCSLGVTTDSGYATSAETMPGAVAVAAPAAITLGDSLSLTWTAAAGADYYEVTLGFDGAGGDTLSRSVRTRDTSVVFVPEQVGVPGEWSGSVSSVVGTFPEAGAEGNIDGDGWGFFTLSYLHASGLFHVTVSE